MPNSPITLFYLLYFHFLLFHQPPNIRSLLPHEKNLHPRWHRLYFG
jgi:hypothetical protein